VNGAGLAGRNFPELRKAPKVIQANEVAGLGRPSQALNPPLIACLANLVPIIKRIAPTLPMGTEIVWRNPRYDLRLQVIFVKPEKVSMRPNVRAVVVDKNGDVAHNFD
jgi:hypothetical protein